MNSRNYSIGLVGASLLLCGVFAPVISLPIMGNLNLYQNGKSDGTIVLIVAVISLGLVLIKQFKPLVATGIIALGIVGYRFVTIQQRISKISESLGAESDKNPFKELTNAAMGSIQMQWGWGVLFVGAVLVILAGTMKTK
ncbi:hypothetical protein [Emticicia sp. 17c]|uniref:hypothetical protein n=1 Tax=Emticicia sp. 17c TaxID=3127704 RepID=UPI00301D748A